MGQLLSESWKILGANGPSLDINGTGLDGAYIDMAMYESVCWIVNLGVTGAAVELTVEEDADGSGSGTAVDFRYRKEDTASGDTLETWAASGSQALTLTTNDSVFYVVERGAWEMSSGKRFIRLRLDDPSAATLAGIVALVKPKYVQNQTPTTKVS